MALMSLIFNKRKKNYLEFNRTIIRKMMRKKKKRRMKKKKKLIKIPFQLRGSK
jgi:hypothetical protein